MPTAISETPPTFVVLSNIYCVSFLFTLIREKVCADSEISVNSMAELAVAVVVATIFIVPIHFSVQI